MNFIPRLLLSVPLMAAVGFCLFGFVATLEPMPRIEQWVLRAFYIGAGGVALAAICRLWLRSRTQRTMITAEEETARRKQCAIPAGGNWAVPSWRAPR